MRFLFEKLREGKYDRLFVERDGRREEITCPKIGGIPHDMVHFAVENTMQGDGFLRRVASGEALAFRMAPNVTSDQMERLVEVMQADAISGFPPAADLIDMYRVTCDARSAEPVASFTPTSSGISERRSMVSGKRSDAVRAGTL